MKRTLKNLELDMSVLFRKHCQGIRHQLLPLCFHHFSGGRTHQNQLSAPWWCCSHSPGAWGSPGCQSPVSAPARILWLSWPSVSQQSSHEHQTHCESQSQGVFSPNFTPDTSPHRHFPPPQLRKTQLPSHSWVIFEASGHVAVDKRQALSVHQVVAGFTEDRGVFGGASP